MVVGGGRKNVSLDFHSGHVSTVAIAVTSCCVNNLWHPRHHHHQHSDCHAVKTTHQDEEEKRHHQHQPEINFVWRANCST